MGSPLFVLWLSGRSREAVMASEESYRAAQSSRQVLRAAPCATLCQSAFLMAMHCGLDNRLALPPFLPVLRNEDGIFAQVLRASGPKGPIAHLPLAVQHDPGELRALEGPRQVAPRLADLLLLLVRSLAPAAWLRDPETRLECLGQGLVQAGSLRPAAFQGLLRELWAGEMSRHVLALERLLEEHGGKPDYWRADAEDWLKRIRGQVTADEPPLPSDLSGPEAEPLTRRVVRAYGELLLAWPALRDASAELVSSGATVASPL